MKTKLPQLIEDLKWLPDGLPEHIRKRTSKLIKDYEVENTESLRANAEGIKQHILCQLDELQKSQTKLIVIEHIVRKRENKK